MGFAGLFGLMAMGVPVGLALLVAGIAGTIAMTGWSAAAYTLSGQAFATASYYELSVLPLFILMGNLASASGLSRDLYEVAHRWIGHLRGGLAGATVLGCAGFAALSGSSIASAVTMGRVAYPNMRRFGYGERLSTGTIAAGGTLGILIPPSTGFVLYATLTEQSIGRLFIAGILPGLMLALGLMVVCYVSARRRGFPVISREQAGLIRDNFWAALPALLMPVFILILLRAGIATPTEVSVVAVAYALMISALLYRDLTMHRLMAALKETGIATGVVMMVIMGSNLVGYVLTSERIPDTIAQWALNTLGSPALILLVMNALLLVVGMFLDLPAAILLLGPTLVGIGQAIGIDPVQLGIIVAVNLSIGLFTPPIGTTLFISSSIARQPIGAVVRELWPFYLVAFTVLMLFTFIPALTIY